MMVRPHCEPSPMRSSSDCVLACLSAAFHFVLSVVDLHAWKEAGGWSGARGGGMGGVGGCNSYGTSKWAGERASVRFAHGVRRRVRRVVGLNGG